MAPILMAILPTIFKALASPVVAGTAASWIASKFGLSDSTVEAVTNFMNGLKPDDQIKLREMDIEFQKFLLDNGIKIDLAQIEVNKEEAKSGNIFIAGWRPYIGWTCGAAFSWNFVLLPVLTFLVYTFGTAGMVIGLAKAPQLDFASMSPVLLGMLGLAGLRTREKEKGTNDKH